MDVRQIVDDIAGSSPFPELFTLPIPSDDARRELVACIKDQSVMYPEVALRAVIALASDDDVSPDELHDFLSGVRCELNALGLERLGIAHSAAVPRIKSTQKGNES